MPGLIETLVSVMRQPETAAPESGERADPRGALKDLAARVALPLRIAKPEPRRALQTIDDFGPNPGALTMRLYVSPRLRRAPAVVVVLHGCKQSADSYDTGSGWSKLADRGGFILVYPEQKARNNPARCFNWFRHSHTSRGGGECASIQAMIETAVTRYRADRRRIFVCGLSAGGAMTGAMLATHPELFRAGAIIAGVPYGSASNVNEAFECMYMGRPHRSKHWGDMVRAAAPGYDGPWPQVAIWHGSADTTVKPVNAGELIKQWTDVHGVGGATPEAETIGQITRRSWRDRAGELQVTEYMIPGMGHGTPLCGRSKPSDDGVPGPFFLAAGLWSSLRIAQDWGLIGARGWGPQRERAFRFF